MFDTQHAPLFEKETGKLVARSGHRGSFIRNSTLSVSGVSNGPYVAPRTVPALESRVLAGVAQLVMTMGDGDYLAFPQAQLAPQELSGWLRIVETGARVVSGSTLFAMSTTADAGARWFLDTNGSFYRFTYNDGSSAVSATLNSGQPTAGQTVDFLWSIASNGALTFSQSINEAAPTSAVSGALALPSASNMPTHVCLNMRGVSGSAINPGRASYRTCAIFPGSLTLTQAKGMW